MRSRNNVTIVVGVVLAVLGAAIAVAYLRGSDAEAGPPTRNVVVAATNIAAGTPVKTARLEVRAVARNAVPSNAVTSLAALTGQVALVPVSANQVVTPQMFGVRGVATTGGVALPKGKKAIGVQLGFAPGALRYVVPGDRIDIVASKRTGNGVNTVVLLKGIEVIATTPGAGTGAATDVQSGPGNLDFLLAVDQEQGLKLVKAQADQQSLYFMLAETGKGAA